MARVRRRTAKVRRRKSSKGKSRRSTVRRRRAAPVRRAPRRAPRRASRRSVRRRNPKPFLQQPAVMDGMWFLGGAGIGAVMNARGTLAPVRAMMPVGTNGTGAGAVSQWRDSTFAALLLGLLARFGLKGKNRYKGYLLAAGLFAPAAIEVAQNAATGGFAMLTTEDKLLQLGNGNKFRTNSQGMKSRRVFSRPAVAGSGPSYNERSSDKVNS